MSSRYYSCREQHYQALTAPTVASPVSQSRASRSSRAAASLHRNGPRWPSTRLGAIDQDVIQSVRGGRYRLNYWNPEYAFSPHCLLVTVVRCENSGRSVGLRWSTAAVEQAHQTCGSQPAVIVRVGSGVDGVREPLPTGWGYASWPACGGGSARLLVDPPTAPVWPAKCW